MPQQVRRFDVRTTDPEVAHAEIRSAYADSAVRLSGSTDDFRFSHSGATVPGAVLGRLHYSMAASADVELPQDRLLVSVLLGGSLRITSEREVVGAEAGRPLLMPTRSGWRGEIAGADLYAVALDRDVVDRSARAAFGSGLDSLRFTSMSPVSSDAARYWRSVVGHVERDVLTNDAMTGQPLALAEVTRSLTTALLLTFPNAGLGRAADPRRLGRAEPAVLRRAVGYVDAHAGEAIGVDDIAAAARIGVRGLQNLFRRHRGCTPLEYLRHVRMAYAHGELASADPTRGDTVAVIAARWGFTHPGRFSVQYRRTYGCSPGETLRS